MEKQIQSLHSLPQHKQAVQQTGVKAHQTQQMAQQVQVDVSKKEVKQEIVQAGQAIQHAEHLAKSILNELKADNPNSYSAISFPNNDVAKTETTQNGNLQNDPSADKDVWQNETTSINSNNSNNQTTQSDF